ncbi:MAG: hypothetical protein PF486_12365 [Prolixibacteraceae bacterium]|nr:hypothetical protein [Prolixibacteraceae bacterium]
MRKQQNIRFYIFPAFFIWIGALMLLTGIISAYLYFSGERPDYLNVEAFAVYSSNIRARYFTSVNNNILDEMAGVFSMTGLFVMFFAKTKNENYEVALLRINSVFWSMALTTFLSVLFFVFVYGWPIFIMSSILFYVFLLLCVVIFRILYWKENRRMNGNSR